MSMIQVRLPEGLIHGLESYVGNGEYASKSDVVRDAIRRFLLQRQVGSIPNTGDSVKEVRAIRKKLSRMDVNIAELNRL